MASEREEGNTEEYDLVFFLPSSDVSEIICVTTIEDTHLVEKVERPTIHPVFDRKQCVEQVFSEE